MNPSTNKCLNFICDNVLSFTRKLQNDNQGLEYRFSLNSKKISPFSLCFAKFIEFLITRKISTGHIKLKDKIIENLINYENERKKITGIKGDKFFLQLFCFSISLLSIINKLPNKYITSVINKIIPENIENLFIDLGVDKGNPHTGNLSMFYGIIFYYENIFIKKNSNLNRWVKFHKEKMNINGFWTKNKKKYLSFQNGYHQYEIFNYLNIKIDKIKLLNAKNNVLDCCDKDGFYAPFPGGHSCYDYDAIFILLFYLNNSSDSNLDIKKKFSLLFNQIILEKNNDGGFCLNKKIRPRKISNIMGIIEHLIDSKNIYIFFERFKHSCAYQLPKYDENKNQFSVDSFKWNESNLWDTWFRVLTLAKIEKYLIGKKKWGFIDFPGLGN